LPPCILSLFTHTHPLALCLPRLVRLSGRHINQLKKPLQLPPSPSSLSVPAAMFCSISRSKNPSDRSTAAYKVKPRRLTCSQNCCKPEGSTGSQDKGPECSNVQRKCSKRFHTPACSVNHFNHPNSYPSQALESLPIYPSREPVSPRNIAQLVLVRPEGAEKEYTDKECIFQGAYGLGLFPLEPELRWVEKNPRREYLFQCHVRHPLRDTETQRPVPGSSSIFHFIHEGVTRCCKRECVTEDCPGCEPPSRHAHEYLIPGSSLMFHATNGLKPRGSMEVQASGRRGAGGMSKADDGQDTVVEAIPRSTASTTESHRRSSSRDKPSKALQTDPFRYLYTKLDSDTPSRAGKPPRASTKLKVYSQDSYLQNYSVRVMEDRTELLPQGNPIRSTRFHHSRQDPLGRGWATEKEARDFGSRPNGWSRGRLESDIVRELHTNSMHFFRQNNGGLQPGTNALNIMTVNHLDERFAKSGNNAPTTISPHSSLGCRPK
jgi:hypothetical protein